MRMKWLPQLLRGTSLATALFVFQACYGTPAAYPGPYEAEMCVHVRDASGRDVRGASVEGWIERDGEREQAVKVTTDDGGYATLSFVVDNDSRAALQVKAGRRQADSLLTDNGWVSGPVEIVL